MGLSNEALEELRRLLIDCGFTREVDLAPREDLIELGNFLLNLTAAAIKTRERLRRIGMEAPPSVFNDEPRAVTQQKFPGFGD